jgi:hypothetical protein
MSRLGKMSLWIVIVGSILLTLFIVARIGIWDNSNVPFCHKQMSSALRMLRKDDADMFPNVEGVSLRSMGELAEALSITTNAVFRDYNYLPGLRADDPKDLVLFYFNRPTRWRLHVQRTPTIWKAKTWIVVPVDAFETGDGRGSRTLGYGPEQITAFGEQSQSLTTEQFTNRLVATLDFLRTNNRPHWQTVVKEHTAFLQSLSR